MARNHARIFTAIWQNHDFVTLSAEAQHLYLLILSQPDLTHCGVIALRARRWSRLATGLTHERITQTLDELVAGEFVVVDDDTEELWVRTFVEHDGVLKQPNVARCALREADEIQSATIRARFMGLYRARLEAAAGPREPTPNEPLARGSRKGSPNPSRRVPAEPGGMGKGERGSLESVVNKIPPGGATIVAHPENRAQQLTTIYVRAWSARRGSNRPPADLRGAAGKQFSKLLGEGYSYDDLAKVAHALGTEGKHPGNAALVLGDLHTELSA